MSRYRSARAGLAGAAVIALAGCGSAAGTPAAASHSLAGSASSSAGAASSSAGSASSSAGSASSPAGTTSAAATPAAGPGSSVAAGSVSFSVAVGNTWVYEVVTNISGRHTLDTRHVVGVTPVPGGHQVTMSDRLVSTSVTNTLQHYLFYDNGQIGFPVSDAHGVSVVSSNGVLWPDAAGVASGRPYRSVLTIKLGSGAYETANVTVQGGGTKSVTVLAGTCQATLVTMTMVMKVGSLTSTAVVKVWTAAGTGPVATEQLITAAGKTQLITTSTLVSFTKRAAGS